jgi:transposase
MRIAAVRNRYARGAVIELFSMKRIFPPSFAMPEALLVEYGRLENWLYDPNSPTKTNEANQRLAQHLFTIPRQQCLNTTNWRAELAIRFGVILRKVWGGNRTWVGARAQAVLMSVWRKCWQQGRSALDFLSHLLRGTPLVLALPP